MKHRIEYDCKCGSCKGTGLYVGMAERDGAAVVCHTCKGTGQRHIVIDYEDFDGLEHRDGVERVYKTNPGIAIGNGNGCALEDFGGIPYQDWLDGKPFEQGTENRKYTCPRWWYQSTDNDKCPSWSECGFGMFTQCQHFPNKSACWDRWDAEFGQG